MQTILTVFHIFLAVGLVGLILIQHGKGADMGAAFGSGASGTVFGAKGSASFLTRTTAILATLFFLTSMVMAYFAAQRDDPKGVMEALQQQAPAVEVQEASPQSDSDIPVVPTAESDLPQVVPAETVQEATAPVVNGGEKPSVSESNSPAEKSKQPSASEDKKPAAETKEQAE
jgi:preprotein translocase subunit SecG